MDLTIKLPIILESDHPDDGKVAVDVLNKISPFKIVLCAEEFSHIKSLYTWKIDIDQLDTKIKNKTNVVKPSKQQNSKKTESKEPRVDPEKTLHEFNKRRKKNGLPKLENTKKNQRIAIKSLLRVLE